MTPEREQEFQRLKEENAELHKKLLISANRLLHIRRIILFGLPNETLLEIPNENQKP